MSDKTSIIEAMFRKQMNDAFYFARLMRSGMGDGIDRDGL